MKTSYVPHLIVTILAIIFTSCSTPYSVSTNPRMMNDWKVVSVELDGDVIGMDIPTPVFDDATIASLKTSKWSLFDAGGGTYTIFPNGDTTVIGGVRRIQWEVVNLSKDSHYFQFQRYTAPKGILTDRFTLYIMQVVSLDKTKMILRYPIKYHDKTGGLVFTFSKGK
jgi:hypothetical protein